MGLPTADENQAVGDRKKGTSTGTDDSGTTFEWDGSQWTEVTGNAKFDIEGFDTLLGRLEGSKKRQQRQRSVEGRRDIYAQGLAGMMSNF